MRRNLKNRPRLKISDPSEQELIGLVLDKSDLEKFLSELSEWLEDFEAELKHKLAGQISSNSESDSRILLINLIREILGYEF
jgi:hypothetical protein